MEGARLVAGVSLVAMGVAEVPVAGAEMAWVVLQEEETWEGAMAVGGTVARLTVARLGCPIPCC